MNKPTDLHAWGVTDAVAELAAACPQWAVGRVLSQEKGTYRVIHRQGEQSAVVSGKYRYEAATTSDYPTVGDFVLLEPASENSPAVIHRLLPRKSVFIRKAAGSCAREQVVAANVDLLFLCMTLGNDFNLRRLERYLSIAWESGATPVIVLTKADLCGDVAEKESSVASIAMGADIRITSSMTQNGCDAILSDLTEGRTIALLGSSGAGKSTLINHLLGEDRIQTGGLRNDEKGRHTTTHRQMFLLPAGGIVIDTPGMRELGMWEATDGLERAFSDVEALTRACRFNDCTHRGEPGCAVRAALESGALTEPRWRSYQKLQAENALHSRAAKAAKFKSISMQNKHNGKP